METSGLREAVGRESRRGTGCTWGIPAKNSGCTSNVASVISKCLPDHKLLMHKIFELARAGIYDIAAYYFLFMPPRTYAAKLSPVATTNG
jgi:hypothetical protein